MNQNTGRASVWAHMQAFLEVITPKMIRHSQGSILGIKLVVVKVISASCYKNLRI